MIKKRRPSELLCRIDVTGFLSILIVLIFLVMTPGFFSHFHIGLAVNMVPVQHAVSLPEVEREDALIVSIRRDGRIYLDMQLMYEAFAAHLQDRVRNGAEKKVYIKVDAHAHFHSVNYVLDQVRLAGIEKVAFLTQPPRY